MEGESVELPTPEPELAPTAPPEQVEEPSWVELLNRAERQYLFETWKEYVAVAREVKDLLPPGSEERVSLENALGIDEWTNQDDSHYNPKTGEYIDKEGNNKNDFDKHAGVIYNSLEKAVSSDFSENVSPEIREKAEKALASLEGRVERHDGRIRIKTWEEYVPSEVLGGDKEVIREANNILDKFKYWLIDQCIDTRDRNPQQTEIYGKELFTVMAARYFNGETKLGAYEKYVVLRRLLREHGDLVSRFSPNFGHIFQALGGVEVKDEKGFVKRDEVTGEVLKTGGIIEGWKESLTAEEIIRFRDNPEGFLSLLRVSELRQLSGGDLSRLNDIPEVKKLIEQGLFSGELDPKEKELFENPGRLNSLLKASFVEDVTTITTLVQQQEKDTSEEDKRRLKEKLKNYLKMGGKGILLLLAVTILQSISSTEETRQ